MLTLDPCIGIRSHVRQVALKELGINLRIAVQQYH